MSILKIDNIEFKNFQLDTIDLSESINGFMDKSIDKSYTKCFTLSYKKDSDFHNFIKKWSKEFTSEIWKWKKDQKKIIDILSDDGIIKYRFFGCFPKSYNETNCDLSVDYYTFEDDDSQFEDDFEE